MGSGTYYWGFQLQDVDTITRKKILTLDGKTKNHHSKNRDSTCLRTLNILEYATQEKILEQNGTCFKLPASPHTYICMDSLAVLDHRYECFSEYPELAMDAFLRRGIHAVK